MERVKLKLSNKNLHTGQRTIVSVERVRQTDKQPRDRERHTYRQERERQTDKREGGDRQKREI
jgi:hypothetical protein